MIAAGFTATCLILPAAAYNGAESLSSASAKRQGCHGANTTCHCRHAKISAGAMKSYASMIRWCHSVIGSVFPPAPSDHHSLLPEKCSGKARASELPTSEEDDSHVRLRFTSAIFDCAEWALLMPTSSDAFEWHNAFELQRPEHPHSRPRHGG